MNKISKKIILAILCLVGVLATGCSNKTEETIVENTSKVLVTVGDVDITQDHLQVSMGNTNLTEKQVLENLIDDQLLLIKAKELNISVSEEEVIKALDEQKVLLEQADDKNKEFIKNLGKEQEAIEAQSWNTVDAQGYKNFVIIEKTKEQLGTSLDTVLSELRNKTKIEYNVT